MKYTLLILLASVCTILGQTPNTNDVRMTLNVPCKYSTNQVKELVWQYRNWTSGIPVIELYSTNVLVTPNVVSTNLATAIPVPTMIEWHAVRVQSMAGQMADSYIEQGRARDTATADWKSLRDTWGDLTPAQRNAVLSAAGVK